jgi:hypothetical protein
LRTSTPTITPTDGLLPGLSGRARSPSTIWWVGESSARSEPEACLSDPQKRFRLFGQRLAQPQFESLYSFEIYIRKADKVVPGRSSCWRRIYAAKVIHPVRRAPCEGSRCHLRSSQRGSCSFCKARPLVPDLCVGGGGWCQSVQPHCAVQDLCGRHLRDHHQW